MGELRTKEEIDAEVEKGKAFVETHPFSIFGTNNQHHYNVFLKLVELVRSGMSQKRLENYADSLVDEDSSFAWDVITWLFQDGFEGENIYS